MYGDRPLVTYEYEYDGNGNITKVYINDELANKYTYDSLNQIKTEYDYVNGFYINYSYDDAGNIHSANTQYLNSNNEPYGSPQGNVYYYNDTEWKDKLTKINGYDITYDESGNPLSYRNGMTFEWENGRQLKQITTSDSTISMNYDSNGMRTRKQVGNTATNYYYDSNNNLVGMTKGNDVLFFYFDTNNTPVAMKLNGTMYFYIKNLQGDIVKIIDSSGVTVASYVYDAWGNITSTTGDSAISTINPFRYRGYVYDDETGLYYLQSRYYDPVTGRFLNADVLFDTQSGTPLSTNMFAYCENNAVMQTDPTGADAWWIQSPKSANGFGHTSLLIQEKSGYWWYFYWGDKSIQLLFLGTTSLEDIDNKVSRFIRLLKYAYPKYSYISYDERYTKAIKFSGSFIKSYLKTNSLVLAECEKNKAYVRFQFNPNCKDEPKKINLRAFTHKYYSYNGSNYYRPYSYIITSNSSYGLLSNNCIYKSLEMLYYGNLNNRKDDFKHKLYWMKFFIRTPNRAYDMILKEKFGQQIFNKNYYYGPWR